MSIQRCSTLRSPWLADTALVSGGHRRYRRHRLLPTTLVASRHNSANDWVSVKVSSPHGNTCVFSPVTSTRYSATLDAPVHRAALPLTVGPPVTVSAGTPAAQECHSPAGDGERRRCAVFKSQVSSYHWGYHRRDGCCPVTSPGSVTWIHRRPLWPPRPSLSWPAFPNSSLNPLMVKLNAPVSRHKSNAATS